MARPSKLDVAQVNELIARYQKGERVAVIAEDLGVRKEAAYYHLAMHDIPRSRNFINLTAEEILSVQRLHDDGYSNSDIGRRYGVSRQAIRQHLQHGNNPRKPRGQGQRKYDCNHDYFHSIDTESKAYWLGFLTADLCLTKSNKLDLRLATKDVGHIRSFAQAIEANNPILYYCYPNRNPPVDECCLIVASPQMSKDLKTFGVTPNKTLSTRFPSIDPTLERHFIRGLVDGDGWFISSNRGNLGFGLLGTVSLMMETQRRLTLNCNLRLVKLIANGDSMDIVRFVHEGNTQCVRIANYLYEGATIFLPRKRDKVLTHYQALPKYLDQLRFG